MQDSFEAVVLAIELVAVTVIALGIVAVLVLSARSIATRTPPMDIYRRARHGFGRVLLLGLELLIAADIVATVTIDLTFASVGTLGLLVLVRTFLSWSIQLETEGQWPWESTSRSAGE
jgi:uncharacterized membrane protein